MSDGQTYAVPPEQLASILENAKSGFKTCRGILHHYLEVGAEDRICALLSEVFWTNFNITKLLQEEIEAAKDEPDGQVVMTDQALVLLQTLVFSKKLADEELNKLSVSTRLN